MPLAYPGLPEARWPPETGEMSLAPVDKIQVDLEIRLFGPIDVRVCGQPLPRLRSRKGLWLLALLALRNGRADRATAGGTAAAIAAHLLLFRRTLSPR